jgi:predicted amidohydrolase YtcJ
MNATTIFRARTIHTMNPSRPRGEAVAVRDGRVLGVGTVDELLEWGEATIDDRFRDRVVLPGFVEAHSHSAEGALWGFSYVGYFDRNDPSGKTWKATRSIDDLIDRLREADARLSDPSQPLIAWGFDPIYFSGVRLCAADLDRVSSTRQIFVLHASMHIGTVNSALMTAYGIDRSTDIEGVIKGADGNPSGELQELQGMGIAKQIVAILMQRFTSPDAIRDLARCARNAGVTTFSELGTLPLGNADLVAMLENIVNDPAFPGRFVPFGNPLIGLPTDPAAAAQVLIDLRQRNTDKLFFGNVKLVLDGSIQGFSAKLRWPGYFHGPDQGTWNMPPAQVPEIALAFHSRGLLIHAHCNGDLTTELFIDTVEHILEQHPRWDHRHTVQHCQLATNAMYKRMKALGMCANIFTNHIYYWGDQHRDITVGPDRAAMMNSPAMAQRAGVPFAMHCDASVTPFGGLHLAWTAANRLTASGRVLNELDRISVGDALTGVTIGPAYQLKLDAEVGSIEVGKFADFAVLEDDPFAVDPVELKNVGVWGTVVGGVPFQAEGR